MKESRLSAERVRALLKYFPKTGVLVWRVDHGMKVKAGMLAGYTDKRGYVWIGIDGVVYLAHRLAHLYMTGEWPSHLIDHEDTDKGNNRWKNIRPATNQQNLGNRGKSKNNRSGFKNVHFQSGPRRHPWIVQIKHGDRFHRSTYATLEEACLAAPIARQDMFGEFSRG